jgi:predicted branched-subunit amino acid permease
MRRASIDTHTQSVPAAAIDPHSPITRGRRADLAGGARAMAPWLLGIAPFGLVIGVSAARADIPVFDGWLTGPLIFAGSAQVATIELLDAGAAPVVIVVAALAINLRFVLYSASMARQWHDAPRWWQALAAYLLVDPSFAIATDGYESIPDRRRAHLHYMGAAVTLWFVWLLAIAVGATIGARVPEGLHLEMIIPLFLVGEVVHRVRDGSRHTRSDRGRAHADGPRADHRHRGWRCRRTAR